MGDEKETRPVVTDEMQTRLILTFNRATFELHMGGSVHNLDEALCIIEMTKRELIRQQNSMLTRRILGAPAGGSLSFLGRKQ